MPIRVLVQVVLQFVYHAGNFIQILVDVLGPSLCSHIHQHPLDPFDTCVDDLLKYGNAVRRCHRRLAYRLDLRL